MSDPTPGTSPGTALTLTTAATMSAATLAPAVAWLLNGCPKPVPEGVALTIAALAIIAAHGVQKLIAMRRADPQQGA